MRLPMTTFCHLLHCMGVSRLYHSMCPNFPPSFNMQHAEGGNVCVCVCMCVCVYAYAYMCVRGCAHACVHKTACMCACMCVHVHMLECVCVCVCVCVHPLACTSVHACVCLCVCECVGGEVKAFINGNFGAIYHYRAKMEVLVCNGLQQHYPESKY